MRDLAADVRTKSWIALRNNRLRGCTVPLSLASSPACDPMEVMGERLCGGTLNARAGICDSARARLVNGAPDVRLTAARKRLVLTQ